MIEIEEQEYEPSALPRWVTIPFGIFLLPITLLSIVGSCIILFAPNVPISIMTISIGSIFLVGSIWVTVLALKLIFANPSSGAPFVSPVGLRAIGLVFLAMPIVSMGLGTFWEKPLVHSVMTIAYIGIVLQLFGAAKARESESS